MAMRFPVALSVPLFWTGYVAIILSVGFFKGLIPPQWNQLFWGTVSSLLILGMTHFALRLERRGPADVGLIPNRRSVPRLLLGIFAAFATYGLIVLLVSTLLGPIQFVLAPAQHPSAIFLTVISTLILAAMEELGFRGYPLRTLIPAIGYWPAQLTVAVAFGLCHFLFGYSWSAILLGVIPCGLLFGVAAAASRGLALPIGIHAGLNLAQWAAGEKATHGIWTIVADEQTRIRIATLSPIIVVAVTLAATLTFWIWGRSREAA